MITLNNINEKVRFDEPSHTYTRVSDGVQLTGVTTMMKKMGISHNYDGIPEDVLLKAAEHGHKIHNACYETHDGEIMDIPEVKFYNDEVMKRGLIPLASEYLVSDFTNIASAIDLVYTTEELAKQDMVILADIKTTANYDGEQLSWQLSIYKKLFEEQNPFIKVAGFIGVWLPNSEKYPDKKPQFKDVTGKPDAAVTKLIDCFSSGTQFVDPTAVALQKTAELAPISDKTFELLKQLDALKEMEKKFKAELMQFLVDNNITEPIEKCGVRVTYVPGTIKKSFDAKKFQKDHPDLYEEYMAESMVKESIRVKLK